MHLNVLDRVVLLVRKTCMPVVSGEKRKWSKCWSPIILAERYCKQRFFIDTGAYISVLSPADTEKQRPASFKVAEFLLLVTCKTFFLYHKLMSQ